MDPELFDAVLTDLSNASVQFDTLIPFWLGEPLIHPEFGRLYRSGLRAAADRGTFRRVELHTNATHLGRDRVQAALNDAPVPQTWHLSIDADTPDRYARIKGRASFAEVLANVEGFLDELARRRPRWPRPVFQMIVGENNAAEVPAFLRRWTSACERRGLPVRPSAQSVPVGEDAIVFFRQLDAPDPQAQERANAAFRSAMAAIGLDLPRPASTPLRVAPGPGVCGCLWKSPVVGWQGDVTTCVRDNRFENRVGNVKNTPLSELWWGPRMRQSREGAHAGNYAGLSASRDCYIPRSANYTGVTPAEIASWA